MRWSDERYVRLYVRDTVDWNVLPWQSRALWPLLLRKVDRIGLLDLGRHGARGLAIIVGLPDDVVVPGLAGLIDDGCVTINGTSLLVPNFIEAQEVQASPIQRSREYRARLRVEARDRATRDDAVTLRDDAVTLRDDAVTLRDDAVTQTNANERKRTQTNSVPSHAVPSHAEEEQRSPSVEDAPPPAENSLGLFPEGSPESEPPHRFNFDAVYAEYPRKRGKSEGLKRLEREINTRADFDALTRAVRHFAEEMQREKREGDKILYFSTWVGQWRDWLVVEQAAIASTPQWVTDLAKRSEAELRTHQSRFFPEDDADAS